MLQWPGECHDLNCTFYQEAHILLITFLLRSNPSTPSSDNKVRKFVDRLDKFVHLELELDSSRDSHKQEVTISIKTNV